MTDGRHAVAEDVSLELHRAAAERLLEDPTLVERARERVVEWLRDGSVARPYAEAWRAILLEPVEDVARFLVDPGERARQLRQTSPFAGVLDPIQHRLVQPPVLLERLTRTARRTFGSLALVATLALAASAAAQEATPAGPPSAPPEPKVESASWEFGLAGALYVLPDEADYVQPTFKADRGVFHFETRYNYEDRDSTSFFVGANFEFGEKVKLALTPMIGGVAGQTEGIVPALEADLTVGLFEAYAEAEYVLDLEDSDSNYFYMWSELSLWPTEWLRAGVVTQRTRVYQTERDIQRGLLVGFALKKVDGTVYFFNPGADDSFTVVSLGLSF